MEKRVQFPPYAEWPEKFKKVFFERLGGWNSIKTEDDMHYVKSIVLLQKDDSIALEIEKYTDIVEILKKDLPRKYQSLLKKK